jgi:FkbM family methyltransferase
MNFASLMDSGYRRWQEIRKPKSSEFAGVDAQNYYYIRDEDSGRQVFVSHQRRLGYYTQGVTHRINNLAKEYQVSNMVLAPDDQVIDVGAHSGEFGLWVERFGSRYLAIEPDPVAFGALQRNFPDARLLKIALGAEKGEKEFYLATSTGDSSFSGGKEQKKVHVAVETLDSVALREFPTGRIALIKVEAEGFEPEVFSGGKETLKRTNFVTVDAGEERDGMSTAPECLNFLLGIGFQVRSVFLKRGIFLLEGPP